MRAALRDYDAVLPTLGDRFRPRSLPMCPAPALPAAGEFRGGLQPYRRGRRPGRGRAVTNTPGAVTDATADIALTLMLMTARRAGEGERLVRAGKWDRLAPTQMLGMHVWAASGGHHRHGPHRQGDRPARHYGFGMEVVFHNRSPVADAGPARAAGGHGRGDGAGFVVVAVPGGPATHHLINAAALAAMKPTRHLRQHRARRCGGRGRADRRAAGGPHRGRGARCL
jgi:lactate dehydrogenase-like 2-hydroxyacid dehydrogenase